jgi:hypothetical protein|tara:strand:- start:470 stop:694 length:225 start_codon:yes stop_codon:yes gene_type:complete
MSTATIVNVSTGEITSRELTAEEEAERQAKAEAATVRLEAEEAAATQAATEKASANTKLKALGLTDAEIAALVS